MSVCYTRGTVVRCVASSFPGSSVVEQPAVNRLVAGSNPARGAKQDGVFRVSGDRRGDAVGSSLSTRRRCNGRRRAERAGVTPRIARIFSEDRGRSAEAFVPRTLGRGLTVQPYVVD